MSCILTVSDKYLNVDEALNALSIIPYKITRKGEPIFKSKPDSKKTGHSGMSFEASNADFDNLKKQIADSIVFLNDHKDELAILTSNKAVEAATLDFGIELRTGYNNMAFQSDCFPFELLKLAGDLRIGLAVSLYPTSLDE